MAAGKTAVTSPAAAAAVAAVAPKIDCKAPQKKTYTFLESGFVPCGLTGLKLWQTMGPLIDAHCAPITGHTRISVTAATYHVLPMGAPTTTPKKTIQGLLFTTTPLSARDAIICFAKCNPHVSATQAAASLTDRWAVELQVNHFKGKDSELDSTGCCISAIDRGGTTFAQALKSAGKLTPDGTEACFNSSAKQP